MAIDISATTRRIVYTGSSGVGPYSFAFEVLAETDIAVYFNDTELTLTTDYTVTVNPDGTGSATLIVGSDVPSTPTASDRITIVGDRTIQRTTDFTTGGPLFATSLNDEFDSQTIFVQQVQEQSDRSMRAPNTDPTTVNMVLPRNTVRANKTLAFDANGDPVIGEQIGDNRGAWQPSTPYNKRDLVKDTSNDNVYLCNTAHTSSGSLPISTNTDAAKWDLLVDAESASSYAASAAASAAAAATSETNAAASATSAATSAATATTKASEATTSASNAATSETNAASSASTASTAATTATTKASEASTSASNAATSETNAASSAGSAATSASTATTAAINASASASSAATSSSSASTSAANAATSETNAATSASSAAASATAAQAAAESIDAFYLGAQASDPTVDLNGDPVTAGDWYFNTTANETRIYDGSSWQVTAISTSGLLTSANNLSDVDSASTARTNLGLGSIATQDSSSVSITGGSITGITDLAVADGGTGQSSYTNGQLLIGNNTGNTLTKATLTAGSGISITNGAGAITIASTGGGGFANMRAFTSPGTWTNPGSVTKVKVTVVGGGGGTPTVPTGPGNRSTSGGGGGGCAIKVITIPTSPVPVTRGAGGGVGAAGGTSSFGTYCSATGGGAGKPSSNPSPQFGGNGGVGSGGSLNVTGSDGGGGFANAGGIGGSSFFGGATSDRAATTNVSARAGNNYGGGAGGCGTNANYSITGAAGGAGVVVVEW